MNKILCKFRGMLVLLDCTINSNNKELKCPDCGSSDFNKYHGWIECNTCDFAFLESTYNELVNYHDTNMPKIG